MQGKDQGFQEQAQGAQRGLFQTTVKEGLSVKTQKEEVLQDHSEATDQEEVFLTARKEEVWVEKDHADRSERTQIVREEHLVKDRSVREDLSMKTEKEEDSEAKEEVEDSGILPRRALQERISTMSVTKTKAESTR